MVNLEEKVYHSRFYRLTIQGPCGTRLVVILYGSTSKQNVYSTSWYILRWHHSNHHSDRSWKWRNGRSKLPWFGLLLQTCVDTDLCQTQTGHELLKIHKTFSEMFVSSLYKCQIICLFFLTWTVDEFFDGIQMFRLTQDHRWSPNTDRSTKIFWCAQFVCLRFVTLLLSTLLVKGVFSPVPHILIYFQTLLASS